MFKPPLRQFFLQRLGPRHPGATLRGLLWWHLLHFLCFLWVGFFYRYRAWGRQHVPQRGAVLYVVNHQSFLDPILVGLAAHHRHFFAMARSTLFDAQALAWVIRSLHAIPVARGSADTTAIRRCLEVLSQGHALLIFPEGTRTPDGTTHPFATGTMLLLKRSKPLIVPVAIEGAYRIWPRKQKLPSLTGQVAVMYGQPISADTLLQMSNEQALTHLQSTVETMRLELAQRIGT